MQKKYKIDKVRSAVEVKKILESYQTTFSMTTKD